MWNCREKSLFASSHVLVKVLMGNPVEILNLLCSAPHPPHSVLARESRQKTLFEYVNKSRTSKLRVVLIKDSCRSRITLDRKWRMVRARERGDGKSRPKKFIKIFLSLDTNDDDADYFHWWFWGEIITFPLNNLFAIWEIHRNLVVWTSKSLSSRLNTALSFLC